MLEYINSVTELTLEAKQIDEYLNITCSDDPAEMSNRGSDLSVYIARTGKMLADAKYHLDRKKKSAIMEEIRKIGFEAKIPPSVLSELIKATCENENFLVNWIERLNRAATHQLDWLRTMVSKAKTEMVYSGGVRNQREPQY